MEQIFRDTQTVEETYDSWILNIDEDVYIDSEEPTAQDMNVEYNDNPADMTFVEESQPMRRRRIHQSSTQDTTTDPSQQIGADIISSLPNIDIDFTTDPNPTTNTSQHRSGDIILSLPDISFDVHRNVNTNTSQDVSTNTSQRIDQNTSNANAPTTMRLRKRKRKNYADLTNKQIRHLTDMTDQAPPRKKRKPRRIPPESAAAIDISSISQSEQC